MIGDNMATLRANKAWKRNDQFSHYIGSTKTSRSRRTVSVGATLAAELAEFTRGEPADQLLFTNRNGGQIRHSTFWESTWARAVNAARNPTGPDGDTDLDAPRLTKHPRIHDLRHTHASWMIAAGCDLVVLQRRLGDESITTTVDRYRHLMPQQHDPP